MEDPDKLSIKGVDHFSSIPIELVYNILSFIETSFSGRPNPQLADNHYTQWDIKWPSSIPLYAVAATSRHFQHVVEGFCQHLLHRCGVSISTVQEKINKKSARKSYRVMWIKWSRIHCAFCGRPSQRYALFNWTIKCCLKCDQKEWTDKITMTEVLKSYPLTKLDIFTPNRLYKASELPHLQMAFYDCAGVLTTLFLRREIERRNRLINGNGTNATLKLRKSRRQKIMKLIDGIVQYGQWKSPEPIPSAPLELQSDLTKPRSLQQAFNNHPWCTEQGCATCKIRNQEIDKLVEEEREALQVKASPSSI